MDIKQLFITSLIGYLFGCFQTAYIITKLKQHADIRLLGSNNAGASNVTRVLGWKYGIITAIVDILKGTLAVFIIMKIFPGQPTLHFIAGAFVVIGHIFPVFLGFKGGKGTASIIGICLALDFKIAVIIALSLVIITIITDYIALGTFSMYILFPVLTALNKYPVTCTIVIIITCLIGFSKHIINVKRMLAHEEVGLRQVAKKHE